MEEALVNALKHGNQFQASKRIHVTFRVDDSQVWVQIEDEGDGFSLYDVPNPMLPENIDKESGRGISLMQIYMTTVEYNERGNRVTMIKQRKLT